MGYITFPITHHYTHSDSVYEPNLWGKNEKKNWFVAYALLFAANKTGDAVNRLQYMCKLK